MAVKRLCRHRFLLALLDPPPLFTDAAAVGMLTLSELAVTHAGTEFRRSLLLLRLTAASTAMPKTTDSRHMNVSNHQPCWAVSLLAT